MKTRQRHPAKQSRFLVFIDQLCNWLATSPLIGGASTVLNVSPPPKNRLHRVTRLLKEQQDPKNRQKRLRERESRRSIKIPAFFSKQGKPNVDLLIMTSDQDALQSDWEAVYADLHKSWRQLGSEISKEVEAQAELETTNE